MEFRQVNAIAFQEGELWVVQGIEFDICAHAKDLDGVPNAFVRAVLANVAISEHLGREPLEGIRPAPERFREMFDRSRSEVRPVDEELGTKVPGRIRVATLQAA